MTRARPRRLVLIALQLAVACASPRRPIGLLADPEVRITLLQLHDVDTLEPVDGGRRGTSPGWRPWSVDDLEQAVDHVELRIAVQAGVDGVRRGLVEGDVVLVGLEVPDDAALGVLDGPADRMALPGSR